MCFEKLNFSHLSVLKKLAAENSRLSCQLSAVSLWCYAGKYNTQACFFGGSLFIKQTRPGFGVCYFCPVTPCGELDNALSLLRAYHQDEVGGAFKIWGVTDEILEEFTKVSSRTARFEVCRDRDWAEYIHTRDNLIDMKGKRFHAKKNAVNQFLRQNSDFEYAEINAQNITEVADFQMRLLMGVRKFAEDKEGVRSLVEENEAIARGLAHYEELGLKGGIIRIEGEISAYAFGGEITKSIFDLTFEKALRSYNGIYQVLEQEMLKKSLADYEFINREEDLGNPGLRAAKERLRPDRLLMKHHFEEL